MTTFPTPALLAGARSILGSRTLHPTFARRLDGSSISLPHPMEARSVPWTGTNHMRAREIFTVLKVPIWRGVLAGLRTYWPDLKLARAQVSLAQSLVRS